MIRVIGFGNLLQGDDGLGVHVVQRLARCQLPGEVSVVDGGLMGVSAVELFDGPRSVIVVDALALVEAEGRTHRLAPAAVPPAAARSVHELDVSSLLALLPVALGPSRVPRVIIHGAEIAPPRARFHIGLSPLLERACQELVERVKAEVSCLAAQDGASASPA